MRACGVSRQEYLVRIDIERLDASGVSHPSPHAGRKLFLRKASAILTFGAGVGVPETIDTRLPIGADLFQTVKFMEREFALSPTGHSLVGGLQDNFAQIFHIAEGRRILLASPLGYPAMLWYNVGYSIKSIYLGAYDNHDRIIEQMLGLLRVSTPDVNHAVMAA